MGSTLPLATSCCGGAQSCITTTRWSSRVLSSLKSGVWRDQICASRESSPFGASVLCIQPTVSLPRPHTSMVRYKVSCKALGVRADLFFRGMNQQKEPATIHPQQGAGSLVRTNKQRMPSNPKREGVPSSRRTRVRVAGARRNSPTR